MPCHAIYIHIPFCSQKCPYCDFYSIIPTEGLMDAYTAAVKRALINQPFVRSRLDSIYFGGGTPSLMGGGRLAQILHTVRGLFSVAEDAEITVECNPGGVDETLFTELHAAGVTRISMGMQAANDCTLQQLGRTHKTADTQSSVQAAMRAGIRHISLDLMLATPGQTRDDILHAVQLCDKLGIEHVSAYLLKVEAGTPFEKLPQSYFAGEEEQVARYRDAIEILARYGYVQYEISNFARDGQYARHNLTYWDGGEYLGIGPAAHSFIGGRRCFFERDLDGFIAAPDPFILLADDGAGGDAEEYIMLRLRLTEGVCWDMLAKKYPAYDADSLQKRAQPLCAQGLVIADHSGLRLTVEGFLLSNAIIGSLLA